MSSPLLDPRKKRSILQNQAVIRAVQALRSGQQVGAGTMNRLRTTDASGGRQQGIDPSRLLGAMAQNGGGENPNLAAARQDALANWQGNAVGAEGSYKPPDATPEDVANLQHHAAPTPAPESIDARRQDLLGRTGESAISDSLRQRIEARIAAGRKRRGIV